MTNISTKEKKHIHKLRYAFTGVGLGMIYQCTNCKDVIQIPIHAYTGELVTPDNCTYEK